MYGGGGLSVVGASLFGVLKAEAKLARKAIGPAEGDPPNATGWYGRGRGGPALKVALLGDSSAAGYGVHHLVDTPRAALASGLSERSDPPVYLPSFAFVGAPTQDQPTPAAAALPRQPHSAANPTRAPTLTPPLPPPPPLGPPSQSVGRLADAVRRRRGAGVEVLVGTCPDLGTIQPINPPLKQVARAWSRRLAAAQAIAVVEAGGRTVSLGSILGPEFAAAPALLFGPDQFHPSADGYASLAAVMLPSAMAALGLIPEEDAGPEALRGEGVLPIARAAVEAARTPGTELDGTEVGGQRRGVRGLWVELRHRRRHPRTETHAPEESEPAEVVDPTAADGS